MYRGTNAPADLPRILISAARMVHENNFDMKHLGSRDPGLVNFDFAVNANATGDSDGEDDPEVEGHLDYIDLMLGIDTGEAQRDGTGNTGSPAQRYVHLRLQPLTDWIPPGMWEMAMKCQVTSASR